jgi:hypothetical protein
MKKDLDHSTAGKRKSGGVIPREEWDFNPLVAEGKPGYPGCPDDQLRYCFEYEFSRAAYIESKEGEPGKAIWQIDLAEPVMNKFRELFSPYFPGRPWIQIDPKERVHLLEELMKRDPDQRFPAFQVVTADALVEEGKHMNSIVTPVLNEEPQFLFTFPIRVDLMASDEEIKKSFGTTLSRLREAHAFPVLFEGKGAKYALRTALKALGALRLRKTMAATQVIAHTKKYLGIALYADKSGVSRAKNLADQIISSWAQPSFDERLKRIERIKDSIEVKQLLVLLAAGRTRAAQHYVSMMPGAVIVKMGSHTQLACQHMLRILNQHKSEVVAKKAAERISKREKAKGVIATK